MKQNLGWGGFKVYCWVFALVLLCGGTVHAQKVFDVGAKILSDPQMNVLSANMPQALALAPVAGKVSAQVPLAGVDLATAGVILVNEKSGRRVVLSGLSSRCSEIVLTPLLLAELKQSVLGEAETYTCLVVEKLATAMPTVKRRYSVSAATDGVKCPVFNYGPKDNVKTTTLDQRRLIRISQRAPLYHPADGSPETLAEIERLTEANKTYVYEYELSDGAIYTYQPSSAPLAVLETFTVGDFTVNLTYAFTAEQKTAIQFALQAWSDQLAASIPIRFDLGFASLSGGTLAQASTSYTGSDGRTYPFSVYNHILGYDAYPSDPDFSITFNSNFSFSYGTSGSCPAGFTDFVTVFLHEVAHGLGFAGAMNSDGSYLIAGWPSKWEEYLYYNGSTLNTMTDSGRYTAIRSTALYWDGPNAKAANGGSQIEMYAPSTYAPGSSVSHWDSSVAFTTFMKYSIASGTYCRTINDREAKLLKDVGWTLTGAAPPAAPTGVSAGDGASTASVAVSWTASSGATGYDVYRYTSNNSGSASLQGSDIAATSYTDSTATPGVIYYYWVKAKNASGSSAFSASDSGYRTLSAPTSVSATDSAPSAVTVTWSAPAGASYYRVYRADTAVGTKTALGGWQTALTYSDYSVVAGTTYYYFVAAAVDGSGTRASAYSSYDTGLIPAVAVPSAPNGVSAADGASTVSVAVSWTASSGATAYDVYRHTSDNSVSASLLGSNIAATSYTDSTATPGVLYYYWVKAKNASGTSAFSSSDSGYRTLSAPTGVSATDAAPSAVTVTWSAAAGASYYQVSRATSSGGTKTVLSGWQSALTYSDATAVVGTTYYYFVVAAIDGSGTRASAYSAYDTGFRPSAAAPSAPTGVSAADGASTVNVAVSWTASSGATGYDVYRYTSDNSVSASLLGSDIVGTAYTDNTATAGVLYYYWVKAKNDSGSSAFSTADSGYRALSAPTGVSATDSAPSAVTVTWSASAGATYYQVSRATSSDGAKTALGGWQTALTYADATAVAGTTYYYFVAAAVDGSGTRASAYSSYDTGVRPASGLTLGTALDNTSLTWTTGGQASWSGQAVTTHDGVDAAQSGVISHSQTNWIETTVTGPGTVSFWWNVSSEDYYDKLIFYYDGYEQTGAISGIAGVWSQQSWIIAAGTHTLRWAYVKDFSESDGSDCGWVDQVVWTPDATLGSALDNTSLTWTTGGNVGWDAQTVTTHDGVDAAQSGDIVDNQTSTLETTVTGPGTLTFWWKVSSEDGSSDNYDYLSFEVDGIESNRIDGEANWQQKSVSLSSGAHTLIWSYHKDGSVSRGSDCGWLDQVVWTPSGGSTTTTEVPVPYSWLDSYLVVSGGNYEAAALADADGDGHLTWQEYVAGTNPTNGTSVFKAGLGIVNGARTLTWTPNLGAARTYTVEGKALIKGATWSSPTNAATRFFRVKVAVP